MAYYDDYYSQPYDYDNDYDYDEDDGPPPPDKDWTDPVPPVRNYLKRIQKDCVQDSFKELKDTFIYHLEALVDVAAIQADYVTSQMEENQLNVKIKLPTLEFLDMDYGESRNSVPFSKAKIVSMVGLFQNIFETMNNQGHPLVVDVYNNDEQKEVDDVEESQYDDEYKSNDPSDYPSDAPSDYPSDAPSDYPSYDRSNEPSNVPSDAASKDIITVNVKRGKSVLLTMSGLEMIQNLQRHPVVFRMRVKQPEFATEDGAEDAPEDATEDVTEDATEDATEDSSIEVEAVVRLPETFRQAVLESTKSGNALPLTTTVTGYYPLMDIDGYQVGATEMTLTITCLGCAVVNSVRRLAPELYKYKNPVFMKSMKMSPEEPGEPPFFSPTPGNWKVDFKSSKEILANCKKEVLIEAGYPLRKCNWFKMAQDAMPDEQDEISVQSVKPDYCQFAKWGDHRKRCRELKEQEDWAPRRPAMLDLLDRLLEESRPQPRRSSRLTELKSSKDSKRQSNSTERS